MALIHVFDGITNKTTYTFNGKLSDHLPNINWDNSVILRGGYRIKADYEVGPNDIIYIRKTPGASTTALIIGSAIALVSGGIAAGVLMYNNNKAMAALNAAQQAAKTQSNQKLPYIKGASNMAATGQSFPYAIGQSLMTPYRLCPAHYTIDGDRGSQQYYNVVLEIAYNNILINEIKMGETVIKDFGNETTPQNGVYSFDPGVYYDEQNIIEIRQSGAFENDDFNKKIILTELSKEIPHDHAGETREENELIEKQWKAGVVQELPTNAQAVELIVLFDGLQKYDKSWINQTIKLTPQWTNVNNPTENDWYDFDNGFIQGENVSNTFTYNTSKQMRFIARQDFTAAQAFNRTIKTRIIRTTPKADGSAKDNVYLLAVQTYCYDAKKSSSSQLVAADVLEPLERDKCCRIGVRVAANANTDGQLDAISVIESACARTWDGTVWSETKTPTRNLAAWVLELLTNPHHKPSQYNDAELDLESFGAWYEYCAEPEEFTGGQSFHADGVIVKSTRKKQLIETLCHNGNASLIYNPMTGLIEVAIDNGRDYSVALLNSENIISINTSKEYKRKTDGKKVTYINAAAGYDVDNVIFMRDGGEYDPANDTLSETALEYVTDYGHAFKIAWRQMAEEIAQPRVVTVKTGFESAYYPLYSRVELQHKSLKIGIANGVIKALVWRNSYLQEIHLDGAVTFPETGACGVLINCVSDNGRGLLALKVSGSGKTNILHVETTLRSNADVIPTAGNICSFGKLDDNGEFTLVTSTMKITNIEESDSGYTLTLVDYNPALYEYGQLPEYRSNITSVPNGTTQTVEQQREYITQGDAEASAAGAAQAAVDTVIRGTTFTNVYNIKPSESTLEDIIRKMDEDARNASASISISENEILLQVNDMERELVGLLDIQAGAVTALVEGGGAAGQMSLSLNLPVMITDEIRAQFIAASSEADVNAVYARVENSTYYGIKGNASQSDVKKLWDAAVAAKLLASQIDLAATQINIAAENIKITAGSAAGSTLIENDKIKTSLIDTAAIKATEGFFTDINVSGKITAEKGLIFNYNLYGYNTEAFLLNLINNNFYPNNEKYSCIGNIRHSNPSSDFNINIFSIKKTTNKIIMEAIAQITYKAQETSDYYQGQLELDSEGLWLEGTYLGSNYIYYNLIY